MFPKKMKHKTGPTLSNWSFFRKKLQTKWFKMVFWKVLIWGDEERLFTIDIRQEGLSPKFDPKSKKVKN